MIIRSPHAPLLFYPNSNHFIDGSNKIVDKKEGLAYAREAMDFYENITQEQIDKYNEEVEAELYEELTGVSTKKKKEEKINGYVYFVESDTGFIKVGMTSSLKSRVKSLQSASPHKLELKGYIKTTRYGFLEGQIHNHFSNSKTNGEWFDINVSDLVKFVESKGYDYIEGLI